MEGKAYLNKKKVTEQPEGNLYETPKSLTWELIKTGELSGLSSIIDPCAGHGAIVTELRENLPDTKVIASDWYTGFEEKRDIYELRDKYDAVVTNFPFNQWDDMVRHSLTLSSKVITIGRVNYFGTYGRNESGLWTHLKKVYIFDRMVDYRAPIHPEGFFHVGGLVTGWFIFDATYQGPMEFDLIDVQQYAKLGTYKG